MAVLVVGGTGYVGQFVIRDLLAAGREVHATHGPGPDPTGFPEALHWHAADLTDTAAMTAVLEASAPVAVVNCAAMSALGACERDPATAEAVNCPRLFADVLATRARQSPLLFIHISTDIVFDGDSAKVYDEEVTPAPINAYGRSKAAFDLLLADQTEPTCVVLRPTNIVGPRHPYLSSGTKFLQWLDGRLQLDEPTKLFVDEFRNYVWVEDLVAVILKLIGDFPSKLPPHRLMHCGGPQSLNRVELAQTLATARGYSLTYTAHDGLEMQRIISTPRIEVDLGYPSPLCVLFRSERAEAFLGRPMQRISDCLQASCSRI